MQLAVSCRTTNPASSRSRHSHRARRRVFFETLEVRNVMAPLGAFPDDTGEYMLGDVLVTVVLMESDPTLPGADFSTEDWTTETINAVQTKVQDAMGWWKETLSSMPGIYYNPQLPLLNFKYDWTWALNPVETLYEPINRYSAFHELWIQDFLDQPDVNFAQSQDIYKDVKAFNNFQRERHNTEWAFTIFVANSTNSSSDFFPLNPSPAPGEANYRGAFAFLGGQFLVVPSDRPVTTFAHEAGHIFYALDEYTGGHSYYAKSGYYNTQNTNSVRDNPAENFLAVQQPSIMATGSAQSQAWLDHVTSASSRAAVGWLDSDGDGVMDALDVPFSLKGTGTYNASAGSYRFKGSSQVRTSPNQNTFGGQNTNVVYNDISINKIRRVEYKLDDGAWTTIADYASPGTNQNFDVTIPNITPTAHTLRIRTFDTRTGASSEEFVTTINPADQATPPQLLAGNAATVSGFVFSDVNANGVWDTGEQSLVDWGLELRSIDDQLLTLAQRIEPSDYSENTVLNSIQPGITVRVVGATAGSDLVLSRSSIRAGVGQVFYAGGSANETFATIRDPNAGTSLITDRRLRIEFTSPVTSVSLKAISGAVGSGRSVARLIAYDANNNVIDRYTTGSLATGQSELMTIMHSAADIKYVVAVGHLETEVLFDSLMVGPATSTTTNPDGSFSLHALPPGTYNLKVLSAPNYTAITPTEGRLAFTVTSTGGLAGNQYFAYQYGGNPWRNHADPLNVNATGGITAFDALLIINFINLHPMIPTLVASEAVPGQYLDVNDDSKVSAFDALAIINHLNTHPISGGGEGSGGGGEEEFEPVESDGDPIGNGNGGGAGGESFMAPQTSEEYFAQSPIHVWQHDKDSHHDHSHDELDLGDHDHFDLADYETAHDELFHDEHEDSGLFAGGLLFNLGMNSGLNGPGRTNEISSVLSSTTNDESSLSATFTPGHVLTSWIAPLLDRLRANQLTVEEDQESGPRIPGRSKGVTLLELLARDVEQAADARLRQLRNDA